jgi:hypothetical protein
VPPASMMGKSSFAFQKSGFGRCVCPKRKIGTKQNRVAKGFKKVKILNLNCKMVFYGGASRPVVGEILNRRQTDETEIYKIFRFSHYFCGVKLKNDATKNNLLSRCALRMVFCI